MFFFLLFFLNMFLTISFPLSPLPTSPPPLSLLALLPLPSPPLSLLLLSFSFMLINRYLNQQLENLGRDNVRLHSILEAQNETISTSQRVFFLLYYFPFPCFFLIVTGKKDELADAIQRKEQELRNLEAQLESLTSKIKRFESRELDEKKLAEVTFLSFLPSFPSSFLSSYFFLLLPLLSMCFNYYSLLRPLIVYSFFFSFLKKAPTTKNSDEQ